MSNSKESVSVSSNKYDTPRRKSLKQASDKPENLDEEIDRAQSAFMRRKRYNDR